MSLSKTTLGNFELYTIETGDFKLDGGAMFGVVPKTLWSRGIPADEKNRIQMTMRCMLIKSKSTGKIYLIDNGLGTKFNDKLMKIYQVDFSKHTMEKSFQEHGFSFDDVTDVIFTHLHFDHCGGTSFFDEDGNSHFTFPNAQYHVTKAHWETATNPNAREKASFLPENINPLKESNKVNLVDEGHEFEPGLSTIVVNGHTLGQQLPLIEGDGKKLCFVADLLPTHVHVPLPWVMGYDMYPAETLKEKEEFLQRSVEEDFNLYLEHDYYKEIMKLGFNDGKYSVTKSLSLNEL
jgi:glyoxylase-like metal-dependent hydrolase (beta-lactamase superfamily II)